MDSRLIGFIVKDGRPRYFVKITDPHLNRTRPVKKIDLAFGAL